ncbi:MAG: hypothetical protein M3Z18_05045 [Gemmatimonadota bacterium]|nr:hypothetical protein [Gemmatimonadota bacterium]
MKGYSAKTALIAAIFLATVPSARAQSSAPEEMQAAKFFVGTWNCAHTVGDFSGTYTTTISNALDNRWLKQTYDFPGTSDGGAPVRAEYFIGYDPRLQQWVRFGAMSDALYFVMVAKRTGNSWPWTYVLPGKGGSAVYTKRSDSQYTVDGPTYTQKGKQVTEHHTCKKSP